MRISDWSSDVCSSDLVLGQIEAFRVEPVERIIAGGGLPGDAKGIEAPHLALGGAGASSDAGVLALGVDADHRAVDGQQVGNDGAHTLAAARGRSEEHTSELQSLMRISYAVFCLKKKTLTSINLTSLFTYF